MSSVNQLDGLGKAIPADIKNHPGKIASLLGVIRHQEKRGVYFKNLDGTYTQVRGREILVKPDAIFERLVKEFTDNNLKLSFGTVVNSLNIVSVSAPLPESYDIPYGKDTLKLFINASVGNNSDTITASLVVMRESNAATLTIASDENLSVADVMKNLKSMTKEIKQSFDLLNKTDITKRELNRFFANAIGINTTDIGKTDKQGNKLVSTKTENILKALQESYENAPGAKIGKGTLFGALWALCYYATHLKTVRDTTGAGKLIARAASNLIGDADRLKSKAMDIALSMVQRLNSGGKKVAA